LIKKTMRAVLVAALALCAAVARADEPLAVEYDRLGRYEREEVDAVLAEGGWAVERAPAGKTIGAVHVVTRPVFSSADGFLTVFNWFHHTTREDTIRGELLFAPGDHWDPVAVDETLRHLRDPLYHNVIVVLPLVAADPDHVDALVVVRDIWSLRLNTNWELQGLDLINLSFSLSENNLLGFRKRVALGFAMDQGAIQIGPSYVDPNVLGSRLVFSANWRAVLARADGTLEGSRSDTSLTYPLLSLRQDWAGALTVSHLVGPMRSFLGTQLRTYDNPDTSTVEMQPWVYHLVQVTTDAHVTRALGTELRHLVSVGHELSVVRPTLVDGFPDDPTLRAAFTRDVMPRSELASALYASYQVYTPEYASYRDLSTFDLREDYQLGPDLLARVSVARGELGSEHDFVRLSGTARYTLGWGGGLYRAQAGYSIRLGDGGSVDRNPAFSALLVSPVLGGVLRVVAAGSLEWIGDNYANRILSIGGTTGLRGYPVGAFTGSARANTHLEARTRPLALAFLRFGAVAFWDAGHAAPSLEGLDLHHSVGIGLRTLIPQADPLVMRLDWAFPLTGAGAGWPGRIGFGLDQAF
jgi:hypothetical protein